ncbi:hypothetical protein Sjap_005173 [Stephania japonica]|uniref:Timeless N-terminal domain-containing protein n=1 Tax=Stephania japonica TaxID=461633 RepID=A0AAP0PKW5_9MAGN
MDLEGLSTICAGLGVIEEDDDGNRIDNLKDLQRFLRRDDPHRRSVFKQVCKWNTASKDLVPIIEHCQDDRNLVISAVKVLVFLTMPIDPTSNDIPQQIEYLWGLKASVTRNDTIAVIMSLLEAPLENLERWRSLVVGKEAKERENQPLELGESLIISKDCGGGQGGGLKATSIKPSMGAVECGGSGGSGRVGTIKEVGSSHVKTFSAFDSTKEVGSRDCLGLIDAFTEEDWKLVQLVVTLFRNILAIQDISMQIKASGSATQFLSLRDRFLELLFHENVTDLILVLVQHVGGSSGYLRQDNLLLLETLYYMFLCQDPELIAKASPESLRADEIVKESIGSLQSMMEEEKEKRRLIRLQKLDRHSQFSGTFTRLSMDGSKSLFKGNPANAAHDSLLKPHKKHRGPLKRTVWDLGKLSSSKDVLEMLHGFLNQLLSGAYNGLMESIREDIEKEHHVIESNDVLVFFHVAQFITAFQYRKFLCTKEISSSLEKEVGSKEGLTNTYADSSLFQGNICGPIATTMKEAMFFLVFSKWRNAFEGLKETNDYKFLSAAGALMKTMMCMLRLVLKLLPEDSKEAQTARILLYKLFYDQTDQGLTQFLMMMFRSFDTHKQPKSDLADLIEMMHVIICLMEKFQARGTLRVSKKSRRRKRKVPANTDGILDESLREAPESAETEIVNSTEGPPVDKKVEEIRRNSSAEGNDDVIVAPMQVEDPGMSSNTGHVGNESALSGNKNSSSNADDLIYADSSEEDESPALVEVDFKVSSLISNISNNIVVQKLCWLLKFYKSNSACTNHYILCMLRRICEDLELSPMLYQLSLVTIFYDILVEQKSSPCKEYANIVSFLNNLVRKMLRKMKHQPLLFVELLFWKTRKECHYITSESLLHELGNVKKKTGAWGSNLVDDYGERDKHRGRANRSIADSLGDDEADFAIPPDSSYQKSFSYSYVGNLSKYIPSLLSMPYVHREQDQHEVEHLKVSQRYEEVVGNVSKGKASNSNSDIGDVENNQFHDAYSEAPYLDHKSRMARKRKKKLILDEEMETNIRNLFEKYKSERNCSRLIAEALDPSGGISPVQVSSKLKQLGLMVVSKKQKFHGDEPTDGVDNRNAEGIDVEKLSVLKSSRKRVHAFSKEHELMLKNLFEQFKGNERCSYMIANSLDANFKLTAAQVSRKLKQLGIQIPQKRRLSETKMRLRDEDNEDLSEEEKENDSDEETLSALKRRSKGNRNMIPAKDAITDVGEQIPEIKAVQDDSDDELLISVMEKSSRRLVASARDELNANLVEDGLNQNNSATELYQDTIERDEHNHSYETDIPRTERTLNHCHSEGFTEANEVFGIVSKTLESPIVSNDDKHVEHQDMDEDLADSEEDVIPAAPTNVTVRRKLKMVIDPDDE